MNPLTEYDSPRKFFNHVDNGGKAINGYSLCVLGPGIVASIEPASPSPGEVVKLKLDVPAVAAVPIMQTQIASLQEQAATLSGDIAEMRPNAVEGGRWDLSEIFVATSGPETLSAVIGRYHRIDIGNYGTGDVLTATLPIVDEFNVGRRVSFAELSGNTVGAPSGEINIVTQGGQTIDYLGASYAMTGTYPRATFVAVVDVGPVYGWSLEAAY